MSAYSPLMLHPGCFDSSAIPSESRAFNQKLLDLTLRAPKWKEVGAAEYRRLRAAGKTALPGPTLLPSATTFEIPSRDTGRSIPCRILRPQNNKHLSAVFMHIHGGGWVLQDETYQDPRLQAMANDHGLLCISIGYRLAPEHPFPAGPQDCYDAAEWLISNADITFKAPLGFISGESAGAHLSMLAVLHLLQHKKPEFSKFRLRGIMLHFGCYSLDWTPSVYTYRRGEPGLVLGLDRINEFRDAFLPGWSLETLKDPHVSPLYAGLERLRGRLPPALFTCGTEDCLLDDTLFMNSKWLAAGGESLLSIIPGAPHGYILFPRTLDGSGAEAGMRAVDDFLAAKIMVSSMT
ncbi:Alpha/Beta hydrolase protein [Dactylonectria estremocensis]|uniref:Alpha/Beta hydrolase protein n=1 Tax=Dactylonectria estremocensis TaxID=1079267 RepID=A0A9P9EXL2_9HYPO|nr:Alpha/Beta hydrolase protein [Dactylonectria estremocensis]